jgi:hypothetical protein
LYIFGTSINSPLDRALGTCKKVLPIVLDRALETFKNVLEYVFCVGLGFLRNSSGEAIDKQVLHLVVKLEGYSEINNNQPRFVISS